jgi:hypothetical protein
MKNNIVLALLVVMFSSCSAQKDLTDLNFLLGTWKVENKDTFETWKKISDKEFVGESYKKLNGEKRITETLSIKIVNDKVVYEATVPNQNNGETISFTLNSKIEDRVSFENLSHDFPKKIQYQKTTETKVLVNVFGEDDKGFSYTIIKQ